MGFDFQVHELWHHQQDDSSLSYKSFNSLLHVVQVLLERRRRLRELDDTGRARSKNPDEILPSKTRPSRSVPSAVQPLSSIEQRIVAETLRAS